MAHPVDLRKRIFLPLIAAGIVVFFIGADFVEHLEQHHKNDTVLQLAEAMRSHIRSTLKDRSEMMVANLDFIAGNPAIIAALKKGDRQALLALAAPIYRRLHRDYNVTQFYIDDAHRVNLLRVHEPERHGDTIDRYTALGAERSGRAFSGIELGPLGTFTLRCVKPVFEQGRLLGYIELGQEIDRVLAAAHDMFQVETFLLIDKQFLQRKAWEKGMRLLGRTPDWGALRHAVVVSQSMPQVPVAALDTDAAARQQPGIRIGQDIVMGGRHYWAGIIPMQDAGGRTVGCLVVLRNMTDLVHAEQRELLVFTGISAGMGLLILILFYFILGRTEGKMALAQENLENMATKYGTMFESSTDAIMLLDINGFFDCNQSTLNMFNCPAREAFIGKHPSEFSPPAQPGGEDSMDLANEHIAKAFEKGSHQFEWMHCQLDGSTFPAEVWLTSMTLEGRPVLQATVRNISERKEAQREIRQALNIQRVLDTILNISLPLLTLSEVLNKALDAVLSIPTFALLNKGAIFMAVKDQQVLEMAAQRNLPDALLQSCATLSFGKCLCGAAAASREIVFSSDLDERHEIRYHGIQPHGHYCIPILSEGHLLGVLNAYVEAGHVSDESEKKFLKTVADTLGTVIERKQSEEALEKLAHNDILTGLPNRALFYDRMGQTLAVAQRQKQKCAVLFLDLDRFKDVNDRLGHDLGDLLLKQVATRLLGCVRRMDTVARMGGDEFTVILTNTRIPESVELVCSKIIKTLAEPFELNGVSYNIGCSIGISIYPVHGRDSEALLKHADIAMYHAKRKRNTFCFFHDGLGDVVGRGGSRQP